MHCCVECVVLDQHVVLALPATDLVIVASFDCFVACAASGWLCAACKAGAGGSPGNCDPCPYNTFQAGPGYGDGFTCKSCPSTAFNHYIGETFYSYGMTFWKAMPTPYLCTPRYSQAASPTGHRLGIVDDVFVNVSQATTTDCVKACPADKCCIAEFYPEGADDGGPLCRHAYLPPSSPMAIVKSLDDTVARLYYKLPPSELIAAASIKNDTAPGSTISNSTLQQAASIYTVTNTTERLPANFTVTADGKVKAKTQASGVYAVCDMSAWQQYAEDGWVGTSPNPALVEEDRSVMEWNVLGVCYSESSCHDSCMSDSTCWGFIHVPGKGYTLRTGEMMLGVRSFFVSPDPAQMTDEQLAAQSISTFGYNPT